MLRLTDLELKNRRVLIRADFNVPLADGKITSATRIDAGLESINFALTNGAKVMVMSHLGRPQEGKFDAALSLAPVAKYLADKLNREVKLSDDYLQNPPPAEALTLLENVRFNRGEKANDDDLAKSYAALCDVFVMDAFATAHRAEASTVGVAKFAPQSCAGALLLGELDALDAMLGADLSRAKRPIIAVVGGAKVSSKLGVLEALSARVERLILGGGIANTFLAAGGFNVGKSLYEPGLVGVAKSLLEGDAEIPLPADVVVAKSFTADAEARVKPVTEIADDDLILDLGPATAKRHAEQIAAAKTVLWNGPLGAFELPQFAAATRTIGTAIAQSPAQTIAGGGDTLAAIEAFKLTGITHISTGGGAFLAYLEGGGLVGVQGLG